MNTNVIQHKEAVLIAFNEYTVHYFSQSSNPWEAAYINCFQKNEKNEVMQVGYIVFTYDNGTLPPGQENSNPTFLPTSIPSTQYNHLEPERQKDFFVMYYALQRFDDVINLLRCSVHQEGSVFASCDPFNHVWAIVNNLHLEVGR
jgi:hypothetical protein